MTMCVAMIARFLLVFWFPLSTSLSYATALVHNNVKARGRDLINIPKASRQSATADEELCSCSPRAYDFQLNFEGVCDDDTFFTRQSDSAAFCFFTFGSSPEDVSGGDIGLPDVVPTGRRGLLINDEDNNEKLKNLVETVSFSHHHKHATSMKKQLLLRANNDHTPTVITSVIFAEFDSGMTTIVNQNSTYFETNLTDGAVISYPSLSAQLDPSKSLEDQMDLLPGGVLLLLYGVNKDNIMVENTIAWGYDLKDCSIEPLQIGDAIGWATLDDYTPPKAVFCPAVTATPTSAPIAQPSVSPSASPSLSPALPPTLSPMISPTFSPISFTKSSKSKSCKSSKGNKSSKRGSKSSSTCETVTSEDPYILISHKSSKAFPNTKANKPKATEPKSAKIFKQKSSKNQDDVVGDAQAADIGQVFRPGVPTHQTVERPPSSPTSAITSTPVASAEISDVIETPTGVKVTPFPTQPTITSTPVASAVISAAAETPTVEKVTPFPTEPTEDD